MRRRTLTVSALLAIALATAAPGQGSESPKRLLITQPTSNNLRLALLGNTRAEANPANDRGIVMDDMPMEHMMLQLQRPVELQQALDQFTAELHDPNSPNFHQWLTASQFGERFGLAEADIAKVTTWLESQGFTVNQVYANQVTVDFSGTAGQVKRGFGTEIHHLEVDGVAHIANMTDPEIPAALAPAVAGIASLHDFMPRPMKKKTAHGDYTFSSGGTPYYAVTPADLATIYNLNPLFKAGYSGQGQTIVVIEDTNVYSAADWTSFRSAFGLATYTKGSFTQVHPGSGCTNPGVVSGFEEEAELDAEWASAAAPSATIQLTSCSDTAVTFGGLIALQNLLNAGGTLPSVISISYGECEAANGASANATYSAAYQQAVTAGVSVFVSSGDEGAASCDADQPYATHGVGVSGFSSTPYNVAVGGTDFADTYLGASSSYWNSSNTSTYGSAKSYVPEIPWNDSCASSLIATVIGYSESYGSAGFCNTSFGKEYFLTTAAGSGGPSGCATGSPSISGVVSGTCKGYAKPSWQSVVGNPSDGVRDIPDVSLFAANGVWSHYYVFCDSDVADGGTPCTGAPSSWAGAGGTSFASPIMAGIQALVNQKNGVTHVGNPNPVYYALASAEYGTTGSPSCNSTNGNTVGTTCTFYDVTLGDMDVPCDGTTACYGSSTRTLFGRTTIDYGVLSTSSSTVVKAYGTSTGWDFSTGIGTLNAANLAANWSAGVAAVKAGSVSSTK